MFQIYLITIAIIFIIYYFYQAFLKSKYWDVRHVPNKFNLLGNIVQMFFQKKAFAEIIYDQYQEFPNERFYGFYQGLMPFLLIRDPELIKQICIKDFDHFLNHIKLIDTQLEPIMGRNLFALNGQEWKDMRTTISPVFTTKKIKSMFILMQECADNFNKFFLDKNQDIIEVDIKDIFTRFTNDVIATTAFGIKIDSLRKPDNDFYHMGKTMTNFTLLITIKLLLQQAFPKILKMLRVRIFNEKQVNFFKNIILNTIKEREEKNIIRPDLINLFMEARRLQLNQQNDSNESKMSEIDMVAQALVFFFAGFDTVSTVLCFCMYELAINSDIQDKLQKEIDSIKNNLTYDDLVNLKYLDQVVSETMRLWPPGFQIDRICVKNFTIDGDNPLTIEKGIGVIMPIIGIHRDPKYYPDPMKFDPERFNDDNKMKIPPNCYLPFGAGPRICIASRFALIEVKVMIFNLLSNFTVVPTKKTKVPVKLSRNSFHLNAQDGFWMGLKRRNNK